MKKNISILIPLATGLVVGAVVGRVNKKSNKNKVDIRGGFYNQLSHHKK